MNNKGIAVLFLSALIVVVLFYFFFDINQIRDSEQLPESIESRETNQVGNEDDLRDTVKVSSDKRDSEDQHLAKSTTTLEVEEVCQLVEKYNDWYPEGGHYTSIKLMEESNRWAFARGYYNTAYGDERSTYGSSNDYSYQSLDNLKVMAKTGDAEANARLAYRLANSSHQEAIKKAQPYCQQALIDGYTASIHCLAAPLASQINALQGNFSDKEELKKLETRYEAWKLVAVELDDPLAKQMLEWAVAGYVTEINSGNAKREAQRMIVEIKQKRDYSEVIQREYPELPELAAYMFNKGSASYERINACFK